MDIQIHKATTADMEAVHTLVRELAEYERALPEVYTQASDFRRDLDHGRFAALVALDTADGSILGAAIYYYAYSTWKGRYLWLEDFIVREQYRRSGIGKMLFDAVRAIAEKENTFMKWQVLDWNEPALQFYAEYNAEIQKDWLTCRLKTRAEG